MTTVQKWYLLVIFNIIGITYSLTLFDLSINYGAYPILHFFFIILFLATTLFSIIIAFDTEVKQHLNYLYKEFIKVIKFYLNL
jgi:hypothetical protein